MGRSPARTVSPRATRLTSRSSTGSMSSAAASSSMIDSVAHTLWGPPIERKAPAGVVVV